MKKIIFINFNIHHLYSENAFPVGGATVQTRSWIKGFQANNYRVGVLGLKGTDAAPFVKNNIDFIESYSLTKGIRIIRNLYYRIPRIYSSLKRYNPDLVFMDVPGWSSLAYALITRILNKTFILRISNDIVVDDRFKKKLGIFRYLIFYFSFAFSSIILCQNNYQLEKIKKKFPNQKILLIYNPYDMDLQNVYPSRGKYVAWVGIFQYQKNLGALLEIAKQLDNIEFRIAGKAQETLDVKSNEALQKLKYLDNVNFVGFLSKNDTLEFLASSYCLLNTSYYEGFSNTYLESISVGTPIVSRRAVDPDHIIEKNHLGLVANDYNKLPDQIISLINCDKEEYFTRGSKYLRKNHDPKTLAKIVIMSI